MLLKYENQTKLIWFQMQISASLKFVQNLKDTVFAGV